MILLALALQAAQTPPQTTLPPVADGQEVVVRSSNKPSPQTPATMVVEPVAMFIAACDADGDGITSSAELDACVARSFAAMDKGSGKLRYLAYADWAARYLGDANALPSPFDVDRDNDDQVTLDELQRQFAKLYTRFDKDGRPGISRAELLTFRTAPVDANGPARPGVPKPGDKKGRPDGPPPGGRGRR